MFEISAKTIYMKDDLSVETSVLSAGILLTVDQDYSTFFIFNYNQCYINVFQMNG
jgi:hypothetical protein